MGKPVCNRQYFGPCITRKVDRAKGSLVGLCLLSIHMDSVYKEFNFITYGTTLFEIYVIILILFVNSIIPNGKGLKGLNLLM